MNFSFDHDALPEQQTPTEERTPDGLAFVKALLKSLKTLYNNFIADRSLTLYKLKYSAQVIYLEKLLNEQFNSGLPAYTGGIPTGIYIGKPLSIVSRPVLRRKDELRPRLVLWKKVDPAFDPLQHKRLVIRTKAEFFSGIKFIVYVPTACFDVIADAQTTIRMRGWINFYNDLADYSIVNY
jgi:hypothetical protein